MMFAETDLSHAGLAAMVLSTFGAAATAYFAYLTTRDKLRYDAELVGLRKDVVVLQRQEADTRGRLLECEEDRERLWTELGMMRRGEIRPHGPEPGGHGGNPT